MRWQTCPSGDLDWAEYEGEFVLFHRASGQTHFVNAASALLLMDVLKVPRDASSAAAALAEAQGAVAGPAYESQVFGLMLRLEELGLVDRVVE